MDLTPELFESVTFQERWRGYDPADVDDFLERVAVAVGDLQSRVREANDRITLAERRAREQVDADDSMKRTLVIAQRTADQVLAEADEEADRITTAAREEAEAIIRRAHHDAARVADEAQRRLRDDLRSLERARDLLQADVAALERFTEGERARLRDELAARLAELDDPATLRMGTAPESRPVEVPDPPAGVAPLPVDLRAVDDSDDDDLGHDHEGDAPGSTNEPTQAVSTIDDDDPAEEREAEVGDLASAGAREAMESGPRPAWGG